MISTTALTVSPALPALDAMDNRIREDVFDPASLLTRTQYNALDQITQVTDPRNIAPPIASPVWAIHLAQASGQALDQQAGRRIGG